MTGLSKSRPRNDVTKKVLLISNKRHVVLKTKGTTVLQTLRGNKQKDNPPREIFTLTMGDAP